jgi:hypothetical protein
VLLDFKAPQGIKVPQVNKEQPGIKVLKVSPDYKQSLAYKVSPGNKGPQAFKALLVSKELRVLKESQDRKE